MSWSIWLPFWINIGLLACAIPTVAILPDTHKSTVVSTETASLPCPVNGDIEEAGPLLAAGSEHGSRRYASAFEKPQGFVQETVYATRKLMGLFQGRRNLQVLLCSFFLTALASSDTKLLVQYISKRYEWTFAQVGDTIIAHSVRSADAYLGWLHALGKSYRQLYTARYRHTAPHPQLNGQRSCTWL